LIFFFTFLQRYILIIPANNSRPIDGNHLATAIIAAAGRRVEQYNIVFLAVSTIILYIFIIQVVIQPRYALLCDYIDVFNAAVAKPIGYFEYYIYYKKPVDCSRTFTAAVRSRVSYYNIVTVVRLCKVFVLFFYFLAVYLSVTLYINQSRVLRLTTRR